MIDDSELHAWLDGELAPEAAARVGAAIAADPALAAHAAAHRRLGQRLATGFAPLLQTPTELVPVPVSAPVASLAEARAARAARRPVVNDWRRYAALAATLVTGIVTGVVTSRQTAVPNGIADTPAALVASAALSTALDRQLSGQPGPIRVALSFRNHAGEYCRSFSGAMLAGIACRDRSHWQVRYAAAVAGTTGAYRTAAARDPALLAAGDAMIDGAPLDAKGEQAARQLGWRGQ